MKRPSFQLVFLIYHSLKKMTNNKNVSQLWIIFYKSVVCLSSRAVLRKSVNIYSHLQIYLIRNGFSLCLFPYRRLVADAVKEDVFCIVLSEDCVVSF